MDAPLADVRRSLDPVPLAPAPGQVAAAVREALGQEQSGALDLEQLCLRLNIDLREVSLGGSAGGREGLLVPLPGNAFAAAIDPTPSNGWASASGSAVDRGRRHRFRFRAAHEIGHTFFFDRHPGAEPVRRVFDSLAQERFCDQFANSLLVPSQVAREVSDPSGLIEMQVDYDVSLEVAARAVCSARPTQWIAIWHDDHGGETLPQWSSNGHFPDLGTMSARGITFLALPKRRQLVATSPVKALVG